MQIKYMLDEESYAPEKAHIADAGIDLRVPMDVAIPASSYAVIDTGVHVQIPEGYVGMIKSKSGLNVKHNLTAEGVIDSGYTGSIVVKMYNLGMFDYTFHRGDKLTQLVILPIPLVDLVPTDSFEATERGNNGFGSTGK